MVAPSILRFPEVQRHPPLSTPTIDRLMNDGPFPITLGECAVSWRGDERDPMARQPRNGPAWAARWADMTTGSCRALAGGDRLETVEDCVTETQTDVQPGSPEQRIDEKPAARVIDGGALRRTPRVCGGPSGVSPIGGSRRDMSLGLRQHTLLTDRHRSEGRRSSHGSCVRVSSGNDPMPYLSPHPSFAEI